MSGCRHAGIHLGQRRIHDARDLHGIRLDARDHLLDLDGRRGRTLRKLAHLVGHDRKTAPLLTRTRGLDSSIERQQIGLPGNFLDHAGDRRNLVGTIFEFAYASRSIADDRGDTVDLMTGLLHPIETFFRELHRIDRILLRLACIIRYMVDADSQFLDGSRHR